MAEAPAAAAAAAAAVVDAGSYQNHAATSDAATPKRGQNKKQTKVTPQATKEPQKLWVRNQIRKTGTTCSDKLRTCDVSSSAMTLESSPGHPTEELPATKPAEQPPEPSFPTAEKLPAAAEAPAAEGVPAATAEAPAVQH